MTDPNFSRYKYIFGTEGTAKEKFDNLSIPTGGTEGSTITANRNFVAVSTLLYWFDHLFVYRFHGPPEVEVVLQSLELSRMARCSRIPLSFTMDTKARFSICSSHHSMTMFWLRLQVMPLSRSGWCQREDLPKMSASLTSNSLAISERLDFFSSIQLQSSHLPPLAQKVPSKSGISKTNQNN